MRRPCLFIERIVINTVNFDPVLFRLRISVDDCRAYIKRRINVSRPVKGSKPIFDRFHRYVLSNKPFEPIIAVFEISNARLC